MRTIWYSIFLFSTISLAACSQPEGTPTAAPADTAAPSAPVEEVAPTTPTPTPVAAAAPTPTATPTPTPIAAAAPPPTATITPTPVAAAEPPPTATPTHSPAPTTEATLITAPSPAEPLYTTDFGDGLAEGWSLDQGWQVSQQDGDFVLRGQGTSLATFTEGVTWTDYALTFRLKVLAGAALINYRRGPNEGYLVSFTEEGFITLLRQAGDVSTRMERALRLRGPDTWHTVRSGVSGDTCRCLWTE